MQEGGDFHGLTTYVVGSAHLRLECLAEAGPRIVRLFLAGSEENQLAEVPAFSWETPYGTYFPRGGHRLWHAPEASRSYVPDDQGLEVEELTDGVRLSQPTEAPTGIRKTLEIHLHRDRPALTLHHQLRNEGPWPVELSPWAITQVPLGGVAVLPQQIEPLDEAGVQPNRHLVLWPYASWHDSRLQLHDDCVLITGLSQMPPLKLGCMNRRGWIGYWRQGLFFCKRFEPQPDLPHPDFGCNSEVYCGDLFLEIETLAPLTHLAPGQSTAHVETWEFYAGLDGPSTWAGVQDLVGALGL